MSVTRSNDVVLNRATSRREAVHTLRMAVKAPATWLDVLRLACARILDQMADGCPDIESAARKGVWLFGQVDVEGGEVPLSTLIDAADVYAYGVELTPEQLRETVELTLQDAVNEYLYEHVEDMSGWDQWWSQVDVDDVAAFMHLMRPS